MRFLHEYLDYGISKPMLFDNGYWEIRGDKIYNRVGGSRPYTPSPNDEIIEVNSWNDILKITIRDDSQITGWISPEGEFYGCKPEDHWELAKYVLNSDEIKLERSLWCKIFYSLFTHKYDYFCFREPTEGQRKVLVEKGLLKLEDADL